MAFHKPFRAAPVQLGPYWRARRRRERLRLLLFPIGVLGGAALAGAVAGALPIETLLVRSTSGSELVTGCSVTDGDTLRCDGERIRLIGIDAPEMPGHCRPGRDCAPGDPYASTASLEEGLVGDLRIERVGEDHYGRTLATIAGDHGDLSCWQLRQGQAIYVSRWDNGFRVAMACPGASAGG
jgi:endonuclease YncB( thermonuclease family)